uniref:Uncharacterized protein n=1 Tax=Tanacetum cinerariifolium TaxID=118510 RepID=A0A6L2J2N2_TANCI|nr:hypothetical protein [Tanacetum cinerariifolium]
MNFTSTNYHTKEELRSKGIKGPLKLLSPEYLSQSSVIKQSKNPSSLKHVHFVNSIVILNKENEAEEEGSVEPNKTKYTNRKNSNETDKEVKSEKKVEEETEGEIKEEEEDDPKHFDTFPTMKELGYHVWLLKIPRPPWVKAKIKTGNVNNVKFSCMIDITDRGADNIPHFIMESDDDNCEKTHYSDSLDLGPEYKYDEYACRGIQSLMAAKVKRKNKGEVT